MKIAFIDTYYPPVLAKAVNDSYRARLWDLLGRYFGTSFFYSEAFRVFGWDVLDIIANDDVGRQLWCKEMGIDYNTNEVSVVDQLVIFEPDIVYCQDLNFFPAAMIRELKRKYGWRFVAQHSCPWAGDAQVRAFDLVFTSFPHYVGRIAALGVHAGFLPIAFGHQVLDHVEPIRRDIKVSFVGGLNGDRGHWSAGTEMMERIAEEVPGFKWWGYFIGDSSKHPALVKTYQGEAWGLDMYKVYARSEMVVNRHGEVAEGYSNNMRMFETTGCGALLLTEASKNLDTYFRPGVECLAYREPGELIDVINKALLWSPDLVAQIAEAGQARTMSEHTYERRLHAIEPILRSMRGD